MGKKEEKEGKKEEIKKKKKEGEKGVRGKQGEKAGISLLSKILLFLSSFVLTLLIIWFGFAFYTLTQGEQVGYPTINRSGDKLADMVDESLSDTYGNVVEFDYTVVPYQVSSEEGLYILYIYAYDFLDKYEDIEDSKFIYKLDKTKEKGKFDFNSLEWGEPVNIVIRYRLDKDIQYFLEYSMYVFKRVFPRVFPEESDIFLSYDYLVEREINNWEVKMVEVE